MSKLNRIFSKPVANRLYLLSGALVICIGAVAIASTLAGRHESNAAIPKVDF